MDFTKKLPNESEYIEYKTNANSLSHDMWESISAFENTDGGIIYLGITEKKHKFYPTGIDPQKIQGILDQFWSAINNEAVSHSTIQNEDISQHKLNTGNIVIEIKVREALTDKPICVKHNFSQVFIRKGATDAKVSHSEFKTLMRDAKTDLDTAVLQNFWIEDLNEENINDYKQQITKRKKSINYNKLNTEEFLQRIGVISKDYENDGKLGITAGGLLFFGKNNAILHAFPNFQLDYYDKSDPMQDRWKERVSSIEDDLNIYSFFKIVNEKLRISTKEHFKLDNDNTRIDTSGQMQVALREGLLNTLIHADYYSDIGSKINYFPNYYEFTNPGKMLINKQDFFDTNKSKTRNPIISKLFIQIGFGERAGSGGEAIKEAASNSKLRLPDIETNLINTNLKIWKVTYASSFSNHKINKREANIIKLIQSSPALSLTHKELEEKTGYSRTIVTTNINNLKSKHIIIQEGRGRSTRYSLPRSNERIIMLMDQVKNILKKNMKNNQ
ncbi:hypothetical protein LfDm3_0432 [Fructilactobacillus fructivorans]|uniref:Schlafen AlbA-2 domain-containing protein n=2 Tax=Fructilactobacillus fructivorans TaxID=1614 RepID=A0A0C1Q3P4_9LACO|nr:hypothetical protein LfDm3_0432 [Fructilactobacillus fructivorans]